MLSAQDFTIFSPFQAELVKDILPGSFDLSAHNLTSFNNTLYFQSDQIESYHYYATIAKEQLWKSDGTEAGTNLVKEQGVYSYNPFSLEVNNNTLYFEVSNLDPTTMTSSFQLWKTDGTDTGLQLLKDLGNGFDIGSFLAVENDVYFTVGSVFGSPGGTQLWKTDGTEIGTTLVKDLGMISDLTELNNTLYLEVSSYDPITYTSTAQLWKSDATEAGTTLIKDFRNFNFNGKAIVNDTLFFQLNSEYSATDPGIYQLWKSDGTDTGTTLIKEFGNATSISDFLGDLNNNLYFSTSTYNPENYLYNNQLWKTDGTDVGTTLVQDLGNYNLTEIAKINNTLYFEVDVSNPTTYTSNSQLWKVDGIDGSVRLVKDLGDASINSWGTIDNSLYFQISKSDYSTNTSLAQLWKTDGTDVGTTLVKDFPNSSFTYSYTISELEAINNTFYFQVADPTYGTELWMSDGTETGTMMVADINSGLGSSNPSIPVDVNGTLYLLADDGVHGNELWKLTSAEINRTNLSNSYKDELLVGHVNSVVMNPTSLIPELTSDRSFPTFSNPIETPLNLGFSQLDPLTALGLKVEG